MIKVPPLGDLGGRSAKFGKIDEFSNQTDTKSLLTDISDQHRSYVERICAYLCDLQANLHFLRFVVNFSQPKERKSLTSNFFLSGTLRLLHELCG